MSKTLTSKKVVEELISCLKFKISNPLLTIVLPIVLILSLYGFFSVFIGLEKLTPIYDYGFLKMIRSIIISPLTEEIAIRGFVLGFLMLSVPKLLVKRVYPKLKDKYFLLIVPAALFTQAIIFSYLHGFQSLNTFYMRLLLGLIMGGLYIAFNKNLLPPVVAHIANNALLHVLT